MPDFVDPNTLLPALPWVLLNRNWGRATTYYWSYTAKHDQLTNRDCLFTDHLGAGLASQQQLIDNAIASDPPLPWNYTLPETYEPWIVFPEIGGLQPSVEIWEQMYGAPVEQDEDTWTAGVPPIVIAGSPRARFILGLIIRTQVRLAQVLAAQCLEQLACQDNRGRPPE